MAVNWAIFEGGVVSLSIPSADCRSRLYRIVWETIGGESVHVFVLAGSRAEAKDLLRKAIVLLGREPNDEPSLFSLNSFEDLVNEGMSEDEDLRVFETGWSREDGVSSGAAPVRPSHFARLALLGCERRSVLSWLILAFAKEPAKCVSLSARRAVSLVRLILLSSF